MNIRIAIMSPRNYNLPYVWDCCDIDEFVERFIKGNLLVIGEYQLPIENFVKHNKYIATFGIAEHLKVFYPELPSEDCAETRIASLAIMLALCDINSTDGHATIHNIKVGAIPDDQSYHVPSTSNAEFFGMPNSGGDPFEVDQWKKLINTTEEIVHEIEQRIKQLGEGVTEEEWNEMRVRTNAVAQGMIDRYKGNYAYLKRRLLEAGVETIPGSFQYDDHFDERFGGAKIKIRIAITSPRDYSCSGITIWNVGSVDDFVDRFVREGQLVIGDPANPNSLGATKPLRNFVTYNKHIATFETERPLEDCIYILAALCEVDVPDDKAAFHNIKIDVILDDYDPLKNPKAEAARRRHEN